jgi:hypothetical protein
MEIVPNASEVKLAAFVVTAKLWDSKDSKTIEAETVFAGTKLENTSRMTIPIEVDTPAVNADSEAMETADVVAQILSEATTARLKSKKRDSAVINSRGLAKTKPPISSLENMLEEEIARAAKSLLCHQILSPYDAA